MNCSTPLAGGQASELADRSQGRQSAIRKVYLSLVFLTKNVSFYTVLVSTKNVSNPFSVLECTLVDWSCDGSLHVTFPEVPRQVFSTAGAQSGTCSVLLSETGMQVAWLQPWARL